MKTIIKKFKFRDYGVLIFFILLCAVITFFAPNFLSVRNILNILRQWSMVGIIAMGMTFVIISGNFDISVGAICALSGAIVMKLMTLHVPMVWAIFAAVGICVFVGVVNGFSVAKVGVPSLIATLAMVTMLRGVILLITDGYPIRNVVPEFKEIAASHIGPIPTPVIILFVVIIAAQFLLMKTRYGSHVFAVGGNSEASRLSGINVDKIKILVFAINGFVAGIAGIILSSRVELASPVAAEGYELDAIASVVIGGTSVAGGEGSAVKTMLGVLLMAVIGNAFNLIGIDMKIQYIFKGAVILLAVGFDSYSKKRAIE